MRALIVLAHPCHDGFAHAAARSAIAGLERAGHEADLIDLYADGFRSAMSFDERLVYDSDDPICDEQVRDHIARLQAAQLLVFVYPTWWSGLPAVLKGWLERVMVPGVGFRFDERTGKVRPGLQHVRRIVGPARTDTATFGTENDEPVVIPFESNTITSGQTTYGHRFLAPQAIRVKRFDDYVQALEKARVVLDIDRRKEIIRADADNLAFAQGLTVIHDEGLLEEVAGLVEWPVVMMGSFDPKFLDVPEEVIIATIRANQKCFCLRDAAGKLAPNFIIISNQVAGRWRRDHHWRQ